MLSRIFKRTKTPPYLAMAEFWVYLKEPKAPKQDDVMGRMIQNNPFAKGGRAPIGTKEGLIWSDIRFHMALALREKNSHIFRPDLFEPHVEPSAEALQALSEAVALVKLRYVSDQPLPDKRHLQFLIYAAEAVAELSGSEVIFDLISERLFSPDWLREQLQVDNDGSRRELHLRTIWKSSPAGGIVETLGLQKLGFQELCTPETMADHQVVAMQVLELAAERIWDAGQMDNSLTIEHYGDSFHVLIDPSRKGPSRARILREKH